jgi:hypothetical protein
MAVLGSQFTRPFVPSAIATAAIQDSLRRPGAILLIRHAQVNACLRHLNARVAVLTHEERRMRRDIERSFEAAVAETAPEQ